MQFPFLDVLHGWLQQGQDASLGCKATGNTFSPFSITAQLQALP